MPGLSTKVDPDKFVVAFNREMRRKMARKLKADEKLVHTEDGPRVVGAVIQSRPQISRDEAIERTVQALMDGMAIHTMPGTPVTLAEVLDRAGAAVVEKAWRMGRPIPREQVRAAIQTIYERGEAKRLQERNNGR